MCTLKQQLAVTYKYIARLKTTWHQPTAEVDLQRLSTYVGARNMVHKLKPAHGKYLAYILVHICMADISTRANEAKLFLAIPSRLKANHKAENMYDQAMRASCAAVRHHGDRR